MTFTSPTDGLLDAQKMIERIVSFVEDDEEGFYRLVIGTDSQVRVLNGKSECDFVTAVVIHKKGYGAKYFWYKEKSSSPPVLRDKIYKETLMSIETAHTLVPDLRKKLNGSNYELEIHIDVGKFGKTRDMIKEVVGMVTGSGYTAKTKPDSWGASKVADRYT